MLWKYETENRVAHCMDGGEIERKQLCTAKIFGNKCRACKHDRVRNHNAPTIMELLHIV